MGFIGEQMDEKRSRDKHCKEEKEDSFARRDILSRKDQKIGSAISLFAGSLYLVLRQHLPVQTDSTHAVLVYEELSGRSSFDPWQPSECCLAHQATKKREIRMLRLVQKSSSTTTQILHNSAHSEGVWFAVSILPLTLGRGIFIPRGASFRRDCERGFTARTRAVLYAVKPC